MLAALGRPFGCDLRTLALFRVSLALLILADLALRARDLTAHYTDDGVLPRATLLDVGPWHPSLHLAGGSTLLEAVWFVIAAVAAVALLLGHRTRMATVVSWLLLISLQARNTAVLQGGDVLLRLLLFWAMFLPLGARFSVDHAISRSPATPDRLVSAATVALLAQCMFVYFFSALLKSDPAWTTDGTAVHLALQLDHLTTSAGRWLDTWPALTTLLTGYVWYLELLAPFVIFIPVLFLWFRLTTMTLLIAMHVGFALCLKISLFPYISIVSLLVFLPGEVWDRLHRFRARGTAARIQVYYDGTCDFCHKICHLLRVFLVLPQMEIIPAQDADDTRALMERRDSWIVRADGQDHLRWEALVWLVRQSPLCRGLAMPLRVLGRWGDAFYGWVARNRSRFSNASRLALPWGALRVRPGWAGSIAAVLLLGVVFLGNLATIDVRVPEPGAGAELRRILRLSQNWNMFAPRPMRSDMWLMAAGTLINGMEVDARNLSLTAPDWSKAALIANGYDNYRWRKYLRYISRERRKLLQRRYAEYLCRRWDARYDLAREMRSLKLVRIRERTVQDGPAAALQQTVLWEGECPGVPLMRPSGGHRKSHQHHHD